RTCQQGTVGGPRGVGGSIRAILGGAKEGRRARVARRGGVSGRARGPKRPGAQRTTLSRRLRRATFFLPRGSGASESQKADFGWLTPRGSGRGDSRPPLRVALRRPRWTSPGFEDGARSAAARRNVGTLRGRA